MPNAPTAPADNTIAQRAEERRDLRSQLAGVSAGDQQEIEFRDTSPRRPKQRIYSLKTGDELIIPEHLLDATLAKRFSPEEGGGFMFTAHKDKAPTFKPGGVKCFLHPEAAERPLLDDLGLQAQTCPAAHLANNFSKRQHAQNRHGAAWDMYQEAMQEKRDQEWRDRDAANAERMNKQTEAMLAIATGATASTPAPDAPKAKPAKE